MKKPRTGGGGPVREYVSQEALRVLTQALTETAVSR